MKSLEQFKKDNEERAERFMVALDEYMENRLSGKIMEDPDNTSWTVVLKEGDNKEIFLISKHKEIRDCFSEHCRLNGWNCKTIADPHAISFIFTANQYTGLDIGSRKGLEVL